LENEAAAKPVVIGDETDDDLRGKLLAVLKDLGAVQKSSERGVGGSQEIETTVFEVKGKKLVVEAETYEGLSLTGDKALVEDIQARIKEKT
jgi:hypothetical protein